MVLSPPDLQGRKGQGQTVLFVQLAAHRQGSTEADKAISSQRHKRQRKEALLQPV